MTGLQELGVKAFLVCALVVVSYVGGFLSGFQYGKNKQLADTVAAYQKRGKIDANVDGRSDYQLCLDLGGLPDTCDELRRMDPAAKSE